jgi:hypothetical protein
MLWLTQDATLVCDHGGRVGIAPTQTLVRIKDRLALVKPNPQSRPISACPFSNPPQGIKPCLNTLVVKQGYSTFITIGDRAVCLDTVTGLTDGSPPGTVNYNVVDPGQRLVAAGS